MSLIQEILNLNLNNLKVQYFEPCEGSYSFLLSTTSGRIVSIGWQVQDDFMEKDYFFWEKKIYVSNNEYLSGLMSLNEWNNWPGELFIINNSNIWHVSFNTIEPTGFIQESLNEFLANIKHNFPELRSATEISNQEINKLSIDKEELHKSNLLLSEEIGNLNDKIATLWDEISRLEKKNKNLEETNKDFDEKISNLIKERNYFSKDYTQKVLHDLSSEQKSSLLIIMENSYIDTNGKEQPINQVEINDAILYPDLIVKIPTSFVENWDNAYDKFHFETFEYRRMSPDGKIVELTAKEIIKIPESVFYSKVPHRYDDLGCCVKISKEDIAIKFYKTFE